MNEKIVPHLTILGFVEVQLHKHQLLLIPDQIGVCVEKLSVLLKPNLMLGQERSIGPQVSGHLLFDSSQMLRQHPLVSSEEIIDGSRITPRLKIIKKILNHVLRLHSFQLNRKQQKREEEELIHLNATYPNISKLSTSEVLIPDLEE